MRRALLRFFKDDQAAVAPTVALALFGLLAIGGIGFDYARMAALDTELQNAADQAALAAAGQLDGRTNARARATAAAQAMVANMTRFANDGDGSGTAVTVPTVEFYSSYDPGRADPGGAPGTAADSDANASYVRVTVAPRSAVYALTPVVAAFSSGPMTARALAGLGSAICNVPPVLICNPFESTGGTFDGNALRGTGLQLVQGGSGPWVPGNFGYLDDPNTDNGAPGVRASLGWESTPGNCSAGPGITTETGQLTSVTQALNTRFDIYDNQSCPVGGTCRPSRNSVKDLVRAPGAGTFGTRNNHNNNNDAWHTLADAYGDTLPSSTTPLTSAQIAGITAMGHPRDICHSLASPSCGQVGNGTWDRNAYFQVNYVRNNPTFNWQSAMTTAGYDPGTVTRYQVYRWELLDPGSRPGNHAVNGADWAYGTPLVTSLSPPGDQDRRRISAAVVNCTAQGVQGSTTGIRVESWIDLFLVEPSYARPRTSAADIYVEVIGQTPAGSAGAPLGQVTARNVPRLLE
jgi:Flp pilus assembly protein TadG